MRGTNVQDLAAAGLRRRKAAGKTLKLGRSAVRVVARERDHSPAAGNPKVGSWRHLPTGANGQPAVAFYLSADRAGTHVSWSITVLTLRGEQIAEITSFLGPEHFVPFGLPASLT
jgi:hypothetical protein